MSRITADSPADSWTWPSLVRADFMCRCRNTPDGPYPDCLGLDVDTALLDFLEGLCQNLGGTRLSVNSGYRCPRHNARVGGVPGSQHVAGTAADIVAEGIPPERVADHCERLLGDRGGVGRYENFTHVDLRDEPSRWHG